MYEGQMDDVRGMAYLSDNIRRNGQNVVHRLNNIIHELNELEKIMSQVIFNSPLNWMAGKVKRTSNMSYRRNGDKVFTYTLQHPRGEKDFSEHEKAYRRSFGELSRAASRICHDPAYAEQFNDFAAHGYHSRHKYVMFLLRTGELSSA